MNQSLNQGSVYFVVLVKCGDELLDLLLINGLSDF